MFVIASKHPKKNLKVGSQNQPSVLVCIKSKTYIRVIESKNLVLIVNFELRQR